MINLSTRSNKCFFEEKSERGLKKNKNGYNLL